MSPDGRWLVFLSAGNVVIGALRPAGAEHQVFTLIPGHYAQVYWSPDSATVALSEPNAPEALALLRVSDLSLTSVPLQLNGDSIRLLGWIDGSHLALMIAQSVVSLSLADISRRVILPAPATQYPLATTLMLSPDGAQILYSAYPVRSEQFAPFFDLISTATGQRRHLAAASRVVFRGINSIVWKPKTSIVAITAQLAPDTGASGLILIDTARDTVTHVTARLRYAFGWAPDESGALIMGDWAPGTFSGVVPHMMDALTISASSVSKEIALSDQMVGPFFGFIRTE
jgi:hypothetical protein